MEQAQNIIFLVRKIGNKTKMEFDNDLKMHDLTFSQLQVLHCISLNGGKASQKQIQDFVKVSHPTIVGLVQRLTKSGYVYTDTDENDKRNKIVYASEKAQLVKQELKERREKMEARMVENLSEEELETVSALLTRIYDNISNRKETDL